MIGVEISMSGPVLDGRAQALVERFMESAVADISSVVIEKVQDRLNQKIQVPTPYYETQITMQRMDYNEIIVHDRGIIYGAWLEGVSRRNRTTRFKGYQAFRRAHDLVDGRKEVIVRDSLDILLRELSGEAW